MNIKKLTKTLVSIKELEKKYLKNPNVCINPKCLSKFVEGESIDIEGNFGGSQPVSCLKCGSTWVDCYTLTGIDNINITNDHHTKETWASVPPPPPFQQDQFAEDNDVD
jgi:hypothetical protein